jgi:hypothetical protein
MRLSPRLHASTIRRNIDIYEQPFSDMKKFRIDNGQRRDAIEHLNAQIRQSRPSADPERAEQEAERNRNG